MTTKGDVGPDDDRGAEKSEDVEVLNEEGAGLGAGEPNTFEPEEG